MTYGVFSFARSSLRALASVALAVLATNAPALAADPVQAASPLHFSGYVEGYLGAVNWSQGRRGETDFAYGGAARANAAFNDRWNVEGDLAGDWIKLRSENATAGQYYATLHAYWRNPDAFAIGAFANWQTTSFDGDMSNYYTVLAGPEAQAYFGNFTLYGQGYFGQVMSKVDPTRYGVKGLRLVGRYFVQPNTRLAAEAAYMKVDLGPGLTHLSLAGQADHRFDSSPVSVFGRYQFDRLTSPGSPTLASHKFIAGLRLGFGSGTLLDEDRRGATMDTFRANISPGFAADN